MALGDRLSRYRDFARFAAKYRRADFVVQAGSDLSSPMSDHRRDAEEFARDLEALGPTFIKLGQLLSTRADLLPQPYLEALARLQDDVEDLPLLRFHPCGASSEPFGDGLRVGRRRIREHHDQLVLRIARDESILGTHVCRDGRA